MSLVTAFGEKITLYDKDEAKNKQITAVIHEPRFSEETYLLIAQKKDVTDFGIIKREKTNEYFILQKQISAPLQSTITVFCLKQVYPTDGILFITK